MPVELEIQGASGSTGTASQGADAAGTGIERRDFDVSSCCWHKHGWEAAGEWSVQDATRVSRAEAMARFSLGECRWVDVGAWKRYIRGLDDQEVYEWWVEHDDWRDDERGGGWETHPSERPDGWQEPDRYYEERPYWLFCLPDHTDAHPVWICGLRSDGAPSRPATAAPRPSASGSSDRAQSQRPEGALNEGEAPDA